MFDFLFGPKNPTANWQRPSGLQLSFDLQDGSLNGDRLGEPLEKMSFLGPVEDRQGLRTGEYKYYSLGLCVDCCNDENTIDSFEIVRKDPWEPKYEPFPGRFLCQRDVLNLGTLTKTSFTGHFDPPYWEDKDDDEIILFYEFPNREWQVEFALDGTFNRILVTRAPLLADEEQRLAYAVNKPWPPI